MLDDFPVTPYLSSRESFMKWVHFILNKINVAMEWEQDSFYDSLENYYNTYKPKEVQNREMYKRRKKYIQIGMVFSIIAVILFLLRK